MRYLCLLGECVLRLGWLIVWFCDLRWFGGMLVLRFSGFSGLWLLCYVF